MQRRVAAIALALLVSACASINAPAVRTAVDPGANFSRVHTYMWIGKPDAGSPLMQQRIVEGIDTRLQARGWRRVDSNGDVHIDAHVTSDERQLPGSRAAGTGYLGWGGFGPPAPNSPPGLGTGTVEVGTLIVDIYDGATRREMWRGSASATLQNNPDRMDARLQSALDRMFAGFPPGVTAK